MITCVGCACATAFDQGGLYEAAENFKEKVFSDNRVITGQNPASASVRGAGRRGLPHNHDGPLLYAATRRGCLRSLSVVRC